MQRRGRLAGVVESEVAEVAAAGAAEEATAGPVGAVAQEEEVTVKEATTVEGATEARVAASMRRPGIRAPSRWGDAAAEVRATL